MFSAMNERTAKEPDVKANQARPTTERDAATAEVVMKHQTQKTSVRATTVAEHNREVLRQSRIFTVSVVGGPGCGKTSLIDATIERLMPETHIGVIACDVTSHLDADRMSRHSEQVVQVNTGGAGVLDPTHIRDAIHWLDLPWVDVLFIENVGTLTGAGVIELGQDQTVASSASPPATTRLRSIRTSSARRTWSCSTKSTCSRPCRSTSRDSAATSGG